MKTRIFAIAILLLLGAAEAQANFFTVTLKNGTKFDTRYRPQRADFDANYSVFMTDQGNWMAVANADIEDVTSREEESGFGFRLDTTTVFLGLSANDLVEEDEDGNVTPRYETSDTAPGTDYSINRFLNTPVLGTGNPTGTTGGIPVGGVVE